MVSKQSSMASDSLTSNIQKRYKDLALLTDPYVSKSSGFLEFKAVDSFTNHPVHIRALNMVFSNASQDYNRTISLFLQETLRLNALNGDAIILDSVEYQDGKLCYAMKPIASNASFSPNLNLDKLLKDVLNDVDHLSCKGKTRVHIPQSNIYQIINHSQQSTSYFLQDWNQIMSKAVKKAEDVEAENVYEVALRIIGLTGLKAEDIEISKENSFYDFIVEAAVYKNERLKNNSVTDAQKKLLVTMLKKQTQERPKIKEIMSVLDGNRSIHPDEVTARYRSNSPKEQKESNNETDEEEKNDFHAQKNSVSKINPKHFPVEMIIESESQLKEWLQASNLEKIKTIKLHNFELGAKNVKLIHEKEELRNLIELYIQKCSIPQGLPVICNSSWKVLQTLNLSSCSLGDEEAIMLASNKTWVSLTGLYLDNNRIGDKGIARISQNKTWAQLKILNLIDNSITSSGAKSLAENTSWKNLQRLYLTNNPIHNLGVAALAKNESWVNLARLSLRGCKITNQGTAPLCDNKSWESLKWLDLKKNNLVEEEISALRQRWKGITVKIEKSKKRFFN